MKRVVFLMFIVVAFTDVKAQFPSTDSLRSYNIVWITNNAARAFTNYRLHTLLAGMIDWIDSARASGGGGGGVIGIDSISSLNDSTIRYRKNGTFRTFTHKGVYDTRRKLDTLYKTSDSTFAFTINNTLYSITMPGRTNFVDSIYRKPGKDSLFYRRSNIEYAVLDSTGGLANSNVGGVFRWLIPNTQQIKGPADSWGIKWDSTSTANALTAKPDTGATGLATQYDLTQVGGNQDIQDVLAEGDTALRKIIFKDTASAASTHNFTIETLRPTDYNTAYTFGRQALYHRGISYTTGVNASGRPNVVNSILSYNQNAGSGGRILTDEASYGFRAETHFETGGARLFEFHLPEIYMQDGTNYRPWSMYTSKDTRSTIINSQISAVNFLYLPPAGSAFDTSLLAISPTALTIGTMGNGGISVSNRRNTSNGFGINMTDNGLSITSTSSGANSINLGSATTITNTNNAPALSINPATGFNQPGIRITGGTAGAGKSLIQADITAAGIVPVTFANNNTTAANYISFQVQHAGGRPEMVWWQNSNNYYIFRLRGNSADDSTLRLHYVGNDVLYFKKNGSMGIGITPGAFKLNVEGSVRINKDSVSLQAANDTRHMLVIDTATGRLQRMAIPSGGVADGNGIYDGSGSLSGATTVTMGANSINFTGGNFGISTAGPDRRLDVLDNTNPQIRLTHTDGSVYSDLQLDGSGFQNIRPTGRYIATPTGSTSNTGYVPNVIWSESATATSSGTSETDLHSFTTPATTLGADGESIEFVIHGAVGDNAGNKTIRAYWAGTEVFQVTASGITIYPYELRVTVVRTSSSNARVYAHVVGGGFTFTGAGETNPRITNVTTTFTNTNILKCTGQSDDGGSFIDAQESIMQWRPAKPSGGS